MERIASAIYPRKPGVYIVREEGHERPLYVGQSGSSEEVIALERQLIRELQPRLNIGGPERVLPNSTATIRSRWMGQHLKPRARGSALRRSLGPYLGLVEKKGRYYPAEVEEKITAFLLDCSVEFRPVRTPSK